jgi:hypothetical protein
MASIPYSTVAQTPLPPGYCDYSGRVKPVLTGQLSDEGGYRSHPYNSREMELRKYPYSGGHFDVVSEDGDELMFLRVPISFTIELAPDADKCYLNDVGKLLSVWIASEYGPDYGHERRDN